MSGPRVCLVTQAFWPQPGAEVRHVARLAQSLAERGAKVTVVCRRSQNGLPARFAFRSVWVERLPARIGLFASWRWISALRRWLIEHRDEFDCVLACSAATGIESACARSGLTLIHEKSRDNQSAHLPLGMPVSAPPTDDRRVTARAIFGELDPKLRLPADSLLVLFMPPAIARMDASRLVNTSAEFVRRRPDSQLWLIGKHAASWASHIGEEATPLGDRIIFPGSFDEVSDLYSAADLLVVADGAVPELAIIEAAAHGLAMILTKEHSMCNSFCESGAAISFRDSQEAGLRSAIEKLVREPNLARKLSAKAQRFVDERFNWTQCVDAHWNQLTSRRRKQ